MDINIDLLDNSIKTSNKRATYYNKKERNGICLYNFFCMNNIKICEKIKQIQGFTSNYDIIIEHSPIKIGNISMEILDEYDIIPTKNNDKYVLLQYNTLDCISFNTFLFNLPNPKLFIFYVIDSYKTLLHSFNKLNQNGICLLNLSTKNIVFDKSYKPLLKNFESSLLIENMNNEEVIQIIESFEDYTYKPLEIHVMFYLIKNDEPTLSYSSIEYVCKTFVENMSVLTLFSQQYKEGYYNSSIECLK